MQDHAPDNDCSIRQWLLIILMIIRGPHLKEPEPDPYSCNQHALLSECPAHTRADEEHYQGATVLTGRSFASSIYHAGITSPYATPEGALPLHGSNVMVN